MYKSSDYRSHKDLNNRDENTHLYIRHKEKSMIKFKKPFPVYIERYKNTKTEQGENSHSVIALYISINLSPLYS